MTLIFSWEQVDIGMKWKNTFKCHFGKYNKRSVSEFIVIHIAVENKPTPTGAAAF